MNSTLPGQPLDLYVGQDVLDDLAERLARTRLPGQQAGADWDTGTPLAYAGRLLEHWRSQFDWRAWEARINGFDNRLVDVGGERIHVLVEPGSGSNSLPLVLTNGWPGSFLEFIGIIDMLAHPERHGGALDDAFTVVIPSLPGYGLSPAPASPLSPVRIAQLWSSLARDQFGYSRFGAFGSDWGSLVTGKWAIDLPEGLCGVMLTSPGSIPYLGEGAAPFSAEEIAWQQTAGTINAREGAYQLVQGTKPQSLAYGHTDSPMALAAWVVEKFRGWSKPSSDGGPPMAMDDLIANIMLYWLNGAIAPMWLYLFLGELIKPAASPVRSPVPAAFLLARADLSPPAPREWLERTFDVARLTVAEDSGHFPGLDNPELLVSELREFFRPLR
jgi:pimeloyl-ACP methyl ester carboxylesterase